MPTVLESLQSFLTARSANHPGADLLARWSPAMETQVNVSAAGGEPVDGRRGVYSDGVNEWFPIRIPHNAKDDCYFNDYALAWPFDRHAEAIGSTGWNWERRVSQWVGFDFDAITGHAPGVGLSKEDLEKVRDAAQQLPFVEVRRSTGGKGYHLYVLIDDFPTANHTEHAALARAILGRMSTQCGFNFAAAVDVCGGNLWLWHKKTTPENRGLELLKPATQTIGADDVPLNWRDHVDVVTRKRAKVRLPGADENELDQLSSARRAVPLDETHNKIISALVAAGHPAVWVPDYNLLQTHTIGLAEVHKQLELRGVFDTASRGSTPINCFAFPLPDGGWRVYRFGNSVKESHTWQQDGRGWTWAEYNTPADLPLAARAFGGSEFPTGGYAFETFDLARQALALIGHAITVPDTLIGCETHVKPTKDGRIAVSVKRGGKSDVPTPAGWVAERGGWIKHVINERFQPRQIIDPTDADNVLRVLITSAGEHAGVFVRSAFSTWDFQPLSLVRAYLASAGHDKAVSEALLGAAVSNRWQRVNMPFQPELPGGRQWNIGAAQLRFPPADRADDLSTPHWDRVLTHIGQSLDEPLKDLEWAEHAGIRTGADYFRMLLACIFREPFQPTPYIFLHGPENSGKSILWNAVSLLVTGGVVKADRALTSRSDFNGELADAVFCVVEETDVSRVPGAMNKIKDFVTSPVIAIRRMRTDTYTQPNCTHWFQFSNDETATPIFPGNTRTMSLYVPPLPAGTEIPQALLLEQLELESPAFLRVLLDLELPPLVGRLRIPVVETVEKQRAMESNRNSLDVFLLDECHAIPGARVAFTEFWRVFLDWLPADERRDWSKQAVTKCLLVNYPIGTSTGNQRFIGNLALEPCAPSDPWHVVDRKLTR